MEIPWLSEWFHDPDHRLELLVGAVFVVMWILAKFLDVTSEDYQSYWGKGDDSRFDDD